MISIVYKLFLYDEIYYLICVQFWRETSIEEPSYF